MSVYRTQETTPDREEELTLSFALILEPAGCTEPLGSEVTKSDNAQAPVDEGVLFLS